MLQDAKVGGTQKRFMDVRVSEKGRKDSLCEKGEDRGRRGHLRREERKGKEEETRNSAFIFEYQSHYLNIPTINFMNI